MIEALLRTRPGREFTFAPDVGKFYAKSNEVWLENTTLLQQSGEPDSKHQRLLSFDDFDGNMGTKMSGAEMARLAATLLNRARKIGWRANS